MDKSLVLKGVLIIFLVPLILIVLFIANLFLAFWDVNLLFAFSSYTLLLYALALFFQKNAYSDSEVLDRVTIPNAPEAEELLKRRTRGIYRLINVDLILALGAKKKLDQTGLVKSIKKLGYNLSDPAIIKYISELEAAHVFASIKGQYRVEYSLTEKGEWYYKVAKKYFPKRFFFFVIRHYLGWFRDLPDAQKKASTPR